MDSSRGERRIVTRHAATGKMSWRPPFTRSWRARRRERRLDAVAVVEDISLTGARLVVPRTEGLDVGAIAGVEADGHGGTVEIRWIENHDDPDRARVGVEFRELSRELRRRVDGLIGEGRRESVDWRWEIAR